MRNTGRGVVMATMVGLGLMVGERAAAAPVNRVVNPDFARVFAAQRATGTNLPSARPEPRMLPQYGGEPFLPYGWIVQPGADRQGRLAPVEGGGLRLVTGSNETLTLRQRYIEVTPGVAYTLNLRARGTGRVRLQFVAQTPGPLQQLADATLTASLEGNRTNLIVTPGPHRRLATLSLEIGGQADLVLDSVTVLADASGVAPELLQTAPFQPDADTLFLETFDGPTNRIPPGPGAELTEPGGGRTGRGLRTGGAVEGAACPSGIGNLPDRGTIDFWFKPERLPEKGECCPLALTTQTPGLTDTMLRFNISHWSASLAFGFNKARYAWDAARSEGGNGWEGWKTGTWHHIAGSWDGEVMRLYVDGVLKGVCYGADKQLPRGQALDLQLTAPGVIDDIRISRGLRFGPFVPAGAAPGPFAPAPPANPAPAGVSTSAEPTEEALAAARARDVVPLPALTADYVFGIDRLEPAWQGLTGMRVRRDYFGAGIDVAEIRNAAWLWRLDGVAAGRYFVGVWLETGDASHRTEYSPAALGTSAYLNGWPLRFGPTSEPLQVKPGVWLGELQTATAIELKPSDEIAIAWGANVLRLALYRQAPVRGHGFTGQDFGAASRRLGILPVAAIEGEPRDGQPLTARVTLANPLPYAAPVELEWTLADYYGTPVAGARETATLPPHATRSWTNVFTARGDAQAYQLDVKTRPVPGFELPLPRPREMLELNDYTRLEFLPALPDPLTAWRHVRQDLKDDREGVRQRLSLDGADWDEALLDGRRVPSQAPDGLAFTRTAVPVVATWVSLPRDRFGKWFRKRFVVPEWFAGERCRIEISGVNSEGTVFLNGQRLGHHAGDSRAFSVEATAALRREGTNELLVCVRNAIALVSPDFVDAFEPNTKGVEENQDVWGRAAQTGASLGSVNLLAVPEVFVRQALVVSDVAQGRLRVLARISNPGPAPRRVTLRYRFAQTGKPVTVELPERAVELAPDSTAEVVAEGAAGRLQAWTPRRPVLAQALVDLIEDGRVVDTHAVRFGYRSVTVQGTHLAVNGRPQRLLGAFQYEGAFLERADGIDLSRDAYYTGGVETFDEVGMMHYPWIGIAWAQGWKKLNNQRFWNSARTNAIEMVWQLGSHPSVIGWNIANESYHFAPFMVGAEGQVRHGELIVSLADAIRARVATNLWFLADGDEDLGGRLSFCSFHYLNHGYAANRFFQSPDTFGFIPDGISHFSPDCFFLNRAAETPRKGTTLHMRPDWIYGSAACGDTESFLYNSPGVGISKWIGDRAAVSTAWQFGTGRGMGWTKMAMDGYRDMDAALTGGIYWRPFMSVGTQDTSFCLPEQAVRAYAGSRFDRRLVIFDDHGDPPGRLDFRWQLNTAAGRVVADGRIRTRAAPALIHRDRIRFTVPDVDRPTAFTLAMELKRDGSRVAYEERLLEVWPPLAPLLRSVPGVTTVAVFDPGGTAAPLVARLGYAVHTCSNLAMAVAAGLPAIVIGPDAVTPEAAADRFALDVFLARGGRVLLLRQENGSLLPPDVGLEKKLHSSIGFVRAAAHPVMTGLRDVDFTMWNPDHRICRGAMIKPRRGRCLALVDCGHDGHMGWTPLAEFPQGAGTLLACQLDLVTAFETEPMAAELLRRLLAYLVADRHRAEQVQPLTLVGHVSAAVVRRLREVRADLVVAARPPAGPSIMLLDLTAGAKVPDQTALRAALEAGATVIVHRARPEHAAWLRDLTGRAIDVEPVRWQAWLDRQYLERRDGLLHGLSHVDLYWRPLVSGEDLQALWQVSDGPRVSGGQVHYVVRVAGASDYLFPGGLVDVPVGKGRVVVDQLKWEMPEQNVIGGSPGRYIGTLLERLGVALRPATARPTLPLGCTFVPVDIAAAANRGLRDDQPGDGKGWCDWGPEADLRMFPTGLVTLAGVPFRVPPGDRNAIVLRLGSQFRPGFDHLPASVDILVGSDRVAGLYFLHTAGWAYGLEPFGWRTVEYDDGTKEVMALNGSNMADWNPGRETFPDEEGTATSVAWIGANAQYPLVRVYSTLWVNPHPEKRIRRVILSNSDLPESQWRFVAHLGVTVARLPAAGQVAARRDPAAAQVLVQEALSLIEAGRQPVAAERLEAALRADDQSVAAWIMLADLRAPTATLEEFQTLCSRWSAALSDSYQAYNTLARFLEGKGKRPEALAAYRKSLVLEWNQPPTIRAVERLEKQGK